MKTLFKTLAAASEICVQLGSHSFIALHRTGKIIVFIPPYADEVYANLFCERNEMPALFEELLFPTLSSQPRDCFEVIGELEKMETFAASNDFRVVWDWLGNTK